MSEVLTGDYSPPRDLPALGRKALIVGLVGAALSVVGLLVDEPQFYRSYLVAWLLWLGIALGCLAVLTLQHLAHGQWGLIVRRMLEAATRTLPLLAILFVPIVLGVQHIYSWADPAVVAADELLQHKEPYLNVRAFAIRAAVYFAIWIGIAWILGSMSLKQDKTGDPSLTRKMRTFAAPALGLYALAATFGSFDWLMSLDPHWFSSLFGVYFIGGQGVAAFAFIILMGLWLSRREPLDKHFKSFHFHDYGKFLLAFVMLWTYFAFSQYLIIWSGNLPEEIVWFLHRNRGGWGTLTVALVALHFVLPFLMLLSAGLKQKPSRLALLAVLLLFARWLDLYWQTMPTFEHHLTVHWLDLATVAGVGGLWFFYFTNQLGKRPLLAVNDRHVREAFGDD